MPYNQLSELPKGVKDNLPKHAQEIYLKAYNNAYDHYKDPEQRDGNDTREEVAHKVAWSAVKEKYEKDEKTGNWHQK